jgi:hypothetical protein
VTARTPMYRQVSTVTLLVSFQNTESVKQLGNIQIIWVVQGPIVDKLW